MNLKVEYSIISIQKLGVVRAEIVKSVLVKSGFKNVFKYYLHTVRKAN